MQESRLSRPVIGLLAAIAGVCVLTAFAAMVPVGARKLLLFSVAFGLCAGGIVLWAAREFGLARRWAVCLTVPLVLGGLSLIAVQGHRQLRAERAEAAKADPQQAMALGILEAAAESDPQLAADLDRRRREQDPAFADYLALRVSPLGEWPQPWPTLFWGAEMLLAGAAGGLLVFRRLRAAQEPVEQEP